MVLAEWMRTDKRCVRVLRNNFAKNALRIVMPCIKKRFLPSAFLMTGMTDLQFSFCTPLSILQAHQAETALAAISAGAAHRADGDAK